MRPAAPRPAMSCHSTSFRLLVVVDEVVELTCRDLGDHWAARAAQQADSGQLSEIARLGRSVQVHLVCWPRDRMPRRSRGS